ncbi:MAG TPA: hypothetical protein DEO56_05815 [Nitrosomonas nitrosa]|uniref:hypothetical protein n=1 Tax=Nitrosomonas nitrosa TaxID=52442 RepID=UPI000D4BAFCA|nr:hypothetical protein [Nitrosomonas nitrosa]PTQ89110.1 hypothetical protein C8R30_1468 [Nitrosomonas nitrosa]HBZ30099.1 hypothetical protein [Nitrosomonas nitrosa]HNP52564.1 hypothetical protein [Nitrosomonas nitrosa]
MPLPNKQESTGWNRLNTPEYGGEKKLLTKRRQWQMVNDFEALVWADYKYAEEIEQGRLPKDLKRMLDINLKVRTSRKRNRYPIIPFQHNTPGANATDQAMPEDIYYLAKVLSPSFVTGQTQRISGTGAYDIKPRKRLTVNQKILYSVPDPYLPRRCAPVHVWLQIHGRLAARLESARWPRFALV